MGRVTYDIAIVAELAANTSEVAYYLPSRNSQPRALDMGDRCQDDFCDAVYGAVEGRNYWIRPDQVSRMTNTDAGEVSEETRLAWAKKSTKPSKGDIPGRWYGANTRESIRDDTIRYSLIPNSSVIERPGLPTTSPAGRYALQSEFAELFDPGLDEPTFLAKAEAWRERHLNAGALARIALNRRRAVEAGDQVLVAFPNGETRALTPGPSTDIVKAVVEVFAPTFLDQPGVISLSESGNKVVARDEQLAAAIGLNIAADKNLPDVVLVDLGPEHPLLVFVEAVATDGPVNDLRKASLLLVAEDAGFTAEHVAFVTAYLDRGVQPFRKTVGSVAWGTYVWFASEPDKLVVLSAEPIPLAGSKLEADGKTSPIQSTTNHFPTGGGFSHTLIDEPAAESAQPTTPAVPASEAA